MTTTTATPTTPHTGPYTCPERHCTRGTVRPYVPKHTTVHRDGTLSIAPRRDLASYPCPVCNGTGRVASMDANERRLDALADLYRALHAGDVAAANACVDALIGDRARDEGRAA